MADLLTLALIATQTDSGATTTYKTKNFSLKKAITSAPDEVYDHEVECALTPGSVLGVTHFATVNYMIIHNIDAANFVTIEWDDAAADTNTLVIAAGEVLMVTDVDPSASITIVADTAAVKCDVLIDGS